MKDPVNLTNGQANFILNKALEERKIRPSDIEKYKANMKEEISQLEQRLLFLKEAVGGAVMRVVRRGRPRKVEANHTEKPKTRKKAEVTPEILASRQLQGRYLGLIRQIPESKRGRFQMIAKKKDREAAIKAMQSFLG